MSYAATSSLLHGICGCVFLALALLVTIRGRVSRTGLFLAVASLTTALWAGWIAYSGGFDRFGSLLETLRIGAWALFIGHMLRGILKEGRNLPRWILAVPIVVLMVATAALELPIVPGMGDAWLTQTDRIMKILLAVCGVLLIENLYRNAVRESRWHINLLTIGIGAIFVYEIILYADASLFLGISPALFMARAPVDMLAAPLIALAVTRNRRWMVDIHVSRNIVFHSSTLFISGIFVLAISAAGEILRNIGVTWGPVLEITLIFGSVILVAVVFTSGRARSLLRVYIAQNFFAYRYDYRKMWLGFIDTVSNPSFQGEQLRVRVIRAVADTVDSPAGTLWLNDGDGMAFSQVAAWNLPRGGAPVGPEFAQMFRDGQWTVVLSEPDMQGLVPDVLSQTPRAWLAVPLNHLGRLLGFILLTEPRAAMHLNWENYALLRIVGRQVASYLGEEQAARGLVEARQLQAYSQRFAFVVHDIKNLVSQLSLMMSNGERHADDPEFQRDVLETVRHSVASMNKLLAQLRANREAEAEESVVPAMIVEELVQAWRPKKPIQIRCSNDGGSDRVRIGRDHLDSALRHLLDNAVEISSNGDEIAIDVRHAAGKVMIDVSDKGAGMQADFIASQLFQPFRSTKSEGYGIGAYQTRELIRAAHGDLLVFSEPGKGTTMRIVLPVESAPINESGSTVSNPARLIEEEKVLKASS